MYTDYDLRGLRCPIPLMKLKALSFEEGKIWHVITSDPTTVLDFERFACARGLRIHCKAAHNEWHFWIGQGDFPCGDL